MMDDPKQYRRIVDEIEARGAARLQAQGTLDRGDYFAGAMQALVSVTGVELGHLPGSWTIGMFAGDDPIARAFEKLVGVAPPKNSDWKCRYDKLVESNQQAAETNYELLDALEEAVAILRKILLRGSASVDPAKVKKWEKLLE